MNDTELEYHIKRLRKATLELELALNNKDIEAARMALKDIRGKLNAVQEGIQ